MLDGVALHIGIPVKIADAIVATGNARVRPFGFVAPPGPHKIIMNQIGATVLTANFQVSSDGGTTWRAIGSTLDFIATPTQTQDVYPGVQFRLDVATLTTTPADIYATLA